MNEITQQDLARMQAALEKKVYCIKDKIGENFTDPVIRKNDQEAVRTFQNVCSNDREMAYHHPGDFDLYCVGTFNPITGAITGDEVRFVISAVNAKELKEKENGKKVTDPLPVGN